MEDLFTPHHFFLALGCVDYPSTSKELVFLRQKHLLVLDDVHINGSRSADLLKSACCIKPHTLFQASIPALFLKQFLFLTSASGNCICF